MVAVNEIQNSSVFPYHEEIFIVYMNVRYRKSNTCTCTNVCYQNTYIAYWTTRNRTLWKNFQKCHQIQKDSNLKKNCHLKAMKQMANNYIHLKVAQSSEFLQSAWLGHFYLQIKSVYIRKFHHFTCQTCSPMAHLSWTTSRLKNKDYFTCNAS